MTKSIFALIPFMGRSNEEITAAREDVLATYIEKSGVEAELSIPKGKRLTGDIEAMFASDIVVAAKYSSYDPVCQIVQFAANVYGIPVVEDRFIERESGGQESEPLDDGWKPDGEADAG